jgi:hypothetical protein
MMESTWQKICCFLVDLVNFSYGDPEHSRGGNRDLTVSYSLVCTASRRSCVVLRNTGDVDAEYSTNDREDGGLLKPGDTQTLYNFRGSVYARMDLDTDTGGTLNYLVLGKW